MENGAGERERSHRETDVEGQAPAQVGDEPAAGELAGASFGYDSSSLELL